MTNQIVGAGLLMEGLFENKIYQSYSIAKNTAKAIKEEMQNRISEDDKPVHFEQQGVIVRYMKHPTYSYKVIKLNEFLWDLGILHKVARFNDIPELYDFRNPIEHYTKFNLSKAGRVEKQELNFKDLSDEELSQLWVNEKNKEDQLEKEIEEVKKLMLVDETLNKLPEGSRKLACSYGSVSLLNKKRTHNNDEILSALGKDYIIENSTPSMEEIEKFIVKGYLTNKDLEGFRVLVDMKLKFVMMTQEAYQNQWNVLQSKRNQQSRNLQQLWAYEVEV